MKKFLNWFVRRPSLWLPFLFSFGVLAGILSQWEELEEIPVIVAYLPLLIVCWAIVLLIRWTVLEWKENKKW